MRLHPTPVPARGAHTPTPTPTPPPQSLLSLAVALPQIPLVEIPQYKGVFMPRFAEGSCCGSYNITMYIATAVSLGQTLIHIDTSEDYGSQPAIGAAIVASGLPRSSFFITSKLDVEQCTSDPAALEAALKTTVLTPLGLPYVDLLLLHHAGREITDPYTRPACFDATAAGPSGNGTYYACRIATYKIMQSFVTMGYTRSIGVSNWQVRDMQQLHDAIGVYPPVNQIEAHPYWLDQGLMSFCSTFGILIEAYAPVGAFPRSNDIADANVVAIAAAHNTLPVNILFAFDVMSGTDVIIARSHTLSHMQTNIGFFAANITLTPAEYSKVGARRRGGKGRQCTPPSCHQCW